MTTKDKSITTLGDYIGMTGVAIALISLAVAFFVNVLWPVLAMIARSALRGELVGLTSAGIVFGIALGVIGTIVDGIIRARKS